MTRTKSKKRKVKRPRNGRVGRSPPASQEVRSHPLRKGPTPPLRRSTSSKVQVQVQVEWQRSVTRR
mgnify:CR=1 FL=1